MPRYPIAPHAPRRPRLVLAALVAATVAGSLLAGSAPAQAEKQADAYLTISPSSGALSQLATIESNISVHTNLDCGTSKGGSLFVTTPGAEVFPVTPGAQWIWDLDYDIVTGVVGTAQGNDADVSGGFIGGLPGWWDGSTLGFLNEVVQPSTTYSLGVVCTDDDGYLLAGDDGKSIATWGTFTTDASGNWSYVQPQSTTLGLTAVPAGALAATLTATVAADGSTASDSTGTVEFFEGAASLGTAPVNNGVATLSKTAWSAGNHTVHAVYTPASGAAYAGSTSAEVQVAVTDDVATTVTLAGTATTTAATVTATVAPTGAGGTVTFRRNGAAVGTPVGVSGGTAVLHDSGLTPGTTYAYTASYSGAAGFAASTTASAYSVATAKNSSSVTLSGTTTQNGASLTATVAPGTSGGTVAFARNGTQIGAPVAVSGGKASATDSGLSPATAYTYTATYSGDGTTSGSATTTALRLTTVAVPATQVAATVKVKVTPAKVVVKKTKAKVTITVSAHGVQPTGKITVSIGGKKVKTATLKASSKGKATVTLPAFKKSGKQQVLVSYGGDKSVKPATKAASVTVKRR